MEELALWAACVPCLLLAVSGYVRIGRTRGGFRERGRWHAPLLFTSAALALLAALVPDPVVPAFLAVLPLAVITAMVYRAWQATARAPELGKSAATAMVLVGLWHCIRHELRGARDDLRALRALARRRHPEEAPDYGPGGPAVRLSVPDAPAPASAPQSREVPPLRQDEALGPPPGPAQIAERVIEGTIVVPGPWAEVASWIAGYQPEDDNDQSMFIHGHAAGLVAVMEALSAHAETVVNEIGLDPSYGLAVLEFAAEIAQAAGAGALTDARYHVIYGGVKEAVDNGLILPHNARQWFGGGGSAPQDDAGESAA